LTEKAIFILHINLYNKLVLYQLFHTSHKMLGRTSIVKYDTNIVCISRWKSCIINLQQIHKHPAKRWTRCN
jgi:hypothetical protein